MFNTSDYKPYFSYQIFQQVKITLFAPVAPHIEKAQV
jgi:hypothetical protein